MKWNLTKLLTIIILLLIVSSCSVNKGFGKVEENNIKILKVDSLKFVNYYTCEFESENDEVGFLLINKAKTDLTSFDLLNSKEILFNDLCDVIEFQPNDSEFTFRGHATASRIYVDEELIIDLSNDIEKRYYQLCSNNKFERNK